MNKPDNVIGVPCSLNQNFFVLWYTFLRPFHKLTDREIEVLACFTYHRYLLSESINDGELLDKITMSDDTKRAVKQECDLGTSHFQVIMNKLKKAKAIVDNKINPKFIPNVKKDSEYFSLLVLFDFNQFEKTKL